MGVRVWCGGLIIGNVNTDSGGHMPHSGRKVEPRVLHKKGEDVSAFAAHKAFEYASAWIDRKIGPFASVEGTGAPPRSASSLQFTIVAKELDKVRALADLLDDRVAHHERSACPFRISPAFGYETTALMLFVSSFE